MAKYLRLPVFLILFFTVLALPAQNPFSKGVNITGWFAASSARSVPFTKFTKKDLQDIKSLGCDVIRLPITLHYMTSGAPDYVIDPIFYQYLDQVIDWTEELQLNLIIDNHTIEVAKSKTVEAPLLKIWPQMARHYKNRSMSVFYEILNEPNTLLAADWAAIQSKVVDSIRAYDTKHTIVVTGADWGGISGLINLKKLKDTNLIYSFHFYDPFLFTHQGAGWASPSMVDLANVPFPYDATRMPACPASLKGTWIESSLSTAYRTDGTVARLKSTIDAVTQYAATNGVKIFCGELGVYNQNSPDKDRVEWYKTVTAYMNQKAIPWTMWDYKGGFGLFIKGSSELFEYDLNRPMAEGMGFVLPPVKEFVMKADTVPFDIYTDFPGEGVIANLPGAGTADLFCPDSHDGNYSILLTDLPQYNTLDFNFTLNKDLSKLAAANYTIDFWLKADAPGSNVVLRFIDTKTADSKDHPWRKDYTINSALAPFDGQWHFVQIQLKKFIDAGSWDNNAWYASTNSFDWTAVDRVQIVSETMALTGKKFWFDNLRINGTPLTSTEGKIDASPFKASVYPNPVTGHTTIQYNLPKKGLVNVSIYNLSGKKMATLVDQQQAQGAHQVRWNNGSADTSKLTNGVYICKISSLGKTSTLKIVVKK
ncbi:MAG TPA: cellulase family glycosylhydrolase [Prolixibacteraceae bacterium]|jgi:endoglucanase